MEKVLREFDSRPPWPPRAPWLMAISLVTAVTLLAAGTRAAAQTEPDPHPKSLDEFKAAVEKVLDETGVPGAGITLARLEGVEWSGGIGVADRDARTPVTADTHFRVGSISKTFVAMGLVQLYEDGKVDLDATIAELAPEIALDNAWFTDPVTLGHVLQHSAGFDDMHFNEMYNVSNPPEMPLLQVLRRNTRSRVVRWRPGSRASYSNPGYGVAGYILEKLAGQKFEDYIATEIFKPTGMTSSSFYLRPEDQATLSKGYSARTGRPVPYTPIYLRPAGNMQTTPADMGKFVQLLLNWGETSDDLVVDPEYLSNMEHPRTTLASKAGLRTGYGTGLYSSFVDGFPMLGHDGGIDGFQSTFAYSTSRDVGYAVMLNATHSGEALRRISRLALRYLKKDIEPPPKPEADVPESVLRQYEGYYHQTNPRNQALAFIEWLLAGQRISVNGTHLRSAPVFGSAAALIPVSNNLFRLETDPEPTRVFTVNENGTMVLTGGFFHAERQERWRVESVRWPVLISAALLLTPLLMLIPWAARAVFRRSAQGERGFWMLKACLVCGSLGLLLPFVGVMNVSQTELGERNLWTAAMFVGTILLPAAAILAFMFTVDAFLSRAGRWLKTYALLVSLAALIVSGYLSAFGMLAFRPWAF